MSEPSRREGGRRTTIALPQFVPAPMAASRQLATKARRPDYSRWRVASLIGVHLLIAFHITHWLLRGETLAPLELNEVMYTLELGIITAGFVLMALALVSVVIFGRFFCSWGCHILALQDLCAWLLRRLGLRAATVRPKVLLAVPVIAMLYMFAWPQVARVIAGAPLPTLHLRGDAQGWASFITDDLWRNLPGPGVALVTFGICGFVVVWVMGTRAFCQYACPYGALFAVADRFAPGRIVVDADRCTSCGRCTAVCDSHVRVHEEIKHYGSVVDASCLKDLDCVSACPEGALSFGWTAPSITRTLRPMRARLRSHFTATESALAVVAMVASLLIFRGLYASTPFLLSLAIGLVNAVVVVTATRLGDHTSVRFAQWMLMTRGALTRPGRVFVGAAALLFVFTVHSAFIRYHEWAAASALDEASALYRSGASSDAVVDASFRARDHLRLTVRWGLLVPRGRERQLASAHWGMGDPLGAEEWWQAAIDRNADDDGSRLDLGISMMRRGKARQAVPLLETVARARERSRTDAAEYEDLRAQANEALAAIRSAQGAGGPD